MTAGQYPLVAFYDANGKPIKLAEATSIVVGSISATNYQNLPVVGGGIAASAALPGEIYFRNYTTDNPSGITIPESGSGVLQVTIVGDDPVYSWVPMTGQSYSPNPTGVGQGDTLGVWTQNVLNSLYVNVTGDTMTGTLSTPDIDTRFIDFDVNATADPIPGRIRWNDAYKTLEVDSDNSIIYRVGQEVSIRVENGAGTSLSKGQVVYINGFSAGIPTVALAGNTSESQTHKGMGVLKTNLPSNGSKGSMVVYGILDGINTTAYGPPGTIVYLGTAGAITSAYADAPNHPELIGTVVKQDSSTGALFVHVQHGYELHEIHDVSRSTPSNGQVLTYNSTAGIWEPQTPTTGQVYTPNPSDPATPSVWQRSGSGLDTYYVNKSTIVTAANQILYSTGASAVSAVSAPGTTGTFFSYTDTNRFSWVANPVTAHAADSTIHFTQANIDHGVITGLADNDHPQYVLSNTLTTAGDILYRNTSNQVTRLGKGSDKQVLQSTTTTINWAQLSHADLSNLTTGDPHTQYLLKTGTNAGQIVYRKSDGSSSSINVAAGDDGKYLKYNSAGSSYTWDTPTTPPPTLALGDLTDVVDSFEALSEGDTLTYNGEFWTNSPRVAIFGGTTFITPPEAGSIITLASSLSAVEISNYNISSVSGHISNNSIHWQLSTLNSNYVNTSGDSMTGGLTAPSLSSTTVSAVSAIVGTVSATTYKNLPVNQKIIPITILNPSSITYYPLFYAKYTSEILEVNSVIVNGTSVTWSIWSTTDVSDPTTGTQLYDSKVTNSLTTGNTETGVALSEGWVVLEVVGYSGSVNQLQLTVITN